MQYMQKIGGLEIGNWKIGHEKKLQAKFTGYLTGHTYRLEVGEKVNLVICLTSR